jgi:hypothetical protein
MLPGEWRQPGKRAGYNLLRIFPMGRGKRVTPVVVVAQAHWDSPWDIDLKRLLLLVTSRGGFGLFLRIEGHRLVAELPRALDEPAPFLQDASRGLPDGAAVVAHPAAVAQAARRWAGGRAVVLLGSHAGPALLRHFQPAHFAQCLYDGCLLPPGVLLGMFMAGEVALLREEGPGSADSAPTAALVVDDRPIAREWAQSVAARAPAIQWRALGAGSTPDLGRPNLLGGSVSAADVLRRMSTWRGFAVCPDRPLGSHPLVRGWLPDLARHGVSLVGNAAALPDWVRAVAARRAADFGIAVGAGARQPDRAPYGPRHPSDVDQVLRQLEARAALPHGE